MEELKKIWAQLCEIINYAAIHEEIKELEAKMEFLSMNSMVEAIPVVSKRLSVLIGQIYEKDQIDDMFADYEVLKEFEESGEDVAAELEDINAALRDKLHEIKMRTLFKGEYDGNNAFLTLHAGEGGTEAMDWTQMMSRMYMRWAERKGFKVNVIDSLDGDVAGLKSISLEIIGDNAYGWLRSEAGVHRLVRISPFDGQGRRHTSFSAVEVIPELEAINPDIVKIGDCEIQTFRSGGPGGQHQNKTESGVRLIHKPTGLIAECREERSQIQNKEKCLKMLQGMIVEQAKKETAEQQNTYANEGAAAWGSAIRSYVFMPYQMVKDNRSGYETGKIDDVMDGWLDEIMESYLEMV